MWSKQDYDPGKGTTLIESYLRGLNLIKGTMRLKYLYNFIAMLIHCMNCIMYS